MISELFLVLAEHLKEFAPFEGKGLISKQVDNYTLKITTEPDQKDDNGWKIEQFAIYVFKNNMPIAIVYPNYGEVMLPYTEDQLIEEFKKGLDKDDLFFDFLELE